MMNIFFEGDMFPAAYILAVFLIFFLIGFVSGVYCNYNGFLLKKYLKKNKYERWQEITSLGGFGPGLTTIRGDHYLFNEKDNDDLNILKLKHKIIIGRRYFLLSFFACCFLLLMLYFFWPQVSGAPG